MAGNDFVEVRLTKFGEEYAAGAPITVVEGGHGVPFTVKPGETLRVTRAFDWTHVLSKSHVKGEPLFELVPEESND